MDLAGLLKRDPDGEIRRQLGEIDLEFFNRFYLWEHFNLPPSHIHRALTQKVQQLLETPGQASGVYIMPRGHAKTTIATLGLPLWCACYKKRVHIPIISDSFPQAKDQLATIKGEIEENDRIREDFGDLRGQTWQAADILTSNGVRIRALGQRMKVRGRKFKQDRPDLILADDLEEIQGVQSPTQRDTLMKWFQGSLMKSGFKDTKTIVVGNFLHYDCLLANLCRNPLFDVLKFKAVEEWPERMDLWDDWRAIIVNLSDPDRQKHAHDFYKTNEAEMVRGAKVAWPEGFSIYDLMVIRTKEGLASFNMELQNDPIDPAKTLFGSWGTYRAEYHHGEIWLTPTSGRPAVKLSDCAIFGYTDPSLGSSVRSDYSAIIILAKAPTKQMFVIEADLQRRPPDKIIAAQNEQATKYRITKWGIEKNQFQALLATQSAKESMEQGIYLPVFGITQLANKNLRIQSLQADLENRYILLPETGMELLKEQLEQWPSGAHDDGPDALEGARNLAAEWEPLTASEIVQGDVHQFGMDYDRTASPLAEKDPWAEADRRAEENIRRHLEKVTENIEESDDDYLTEYSGAYDRIIRGAVGPRTGG